ncbi:MAG: hypothetical protein F7C08_02205 [Desulfurococcales archaeon]|nr:hypothetical protein [Desulfurococcales archaeon]MCE4605331.1 hypothetical protein [Desulfurococcales archaeon]
MPESEGVRWARRVVLAKISLTLLIAAAGSAIVYAGSKSGSRVMTSTGLMIVALSPVISYLVIRLYLSRRA